MPTMRAYGLTPMLLVVARLAAAQTTPVDQGVFAITRAGAPYGTESFQVVRQTGPDGLTYTLSSTRSQEGRIIRTALKTDSLGSPITYSRQVSGAGSAIIAASGKTAGRLTVKETSGRNHASKDYLLPAGTLLLDDDLVHQLYFVCLTDTPRTISYVSPGSRTSAEGRLVGVGQEQLELGNRAKVDALHFAFGTGAAKRDIWIDSDKRLLRISIPALQIEALRDEPPR